MYKFLCGQNVFISLCCLPRSRITGSDGNSVFNFLRNFWTVSQSSHTILDSHQQDLRVLMSARPCQHWLLCEFLMMALSLEVMLMLYSPVVLICVSLMINGSRLSSSSEWKVFCPLCICAPRCVITNLFSLNIPRNLIFLYQ